MRDWMLGQGVRERSKVSRRPTRFSMPSTTATATTPAAAAASSSSSSATTASAASAAAFPHRHSRLPLIIIPIPFVLFAPRTLLPSPTVPLSHLRLFHFLDRFALSFSDSLGEEHRFLLAGGAEGVLGHLFADDACFGMMSA